VSSNETDDNKTYVQSSPTGQATVVTTRQAPATVVQAAPAPANQRNETIVTHRSTNTGALAALAVGIVVLLGGIGLVVSQIRFLPWPYSIIVVLGFGLILLIVGASFIDRGADRP
jgi:intracellular septation protein A